MLREQKAITQNKMKQAGLFFLLITCFTFIAGKTFAGEPMSEEQKIAKLIDYVRNLKGATFIRNGGNHSPTEAAEHLALKRKKAGSKVKTAVEFIVFCGSKSSTSGKDYLIKLPDGKTVKSMELLMEELKKIEKSKAG
jgi:hypothetical protein